MATLTRALIFVAGALAASAADTYPSTYPFDSEYGEGLPDVNFVDATPSYNYGTSDKGGYSKLRYACDFAAEMAKDVLYGTDGKEIANGRSAAIKETIVNATIAGSKVWGNSTFSITGAKTWSPWYCPGAQFSAKTYLVDKNSDLSKVKTVCTVPKAMKMQWDTKWAAQITAGSKKSFSGYVGQQIKTDGSIGTTPDCTDCCKKFNQDDTDHNLRAGIRVWVPPTSGLSIIQNFLRNDMCTISLGEAAKCFIIESYNPVCVQNYVSASKRSYVYPCPDILLRHYYSCKLRMAAPILADAPEPPQYAKKVSAKQGASQMALNRSPDKVCQPYSYFYPALAKPAGSKDYYSPGSPLGSNDPSGGAPAGTPSSPAGTTAPKSAGIMAKSAALVLSLVIMFVAQL